MFQPSQPSFDDLIEARQFLFEIAPAGGGNAVGLPPVLRLDGADPAALLQARDGSIQITSGCPWAGSEAGKSVLVSRSLVIVTGPAAHRAYFHGERNHQGKQNRLLFPPAAPEATRSRKDVRCRERLGGLLRYYARAA
jgi:hypothetical protein